MDRQAKNGIWKYQEKLPFVPEKYRLTLGEGNTSLVKKGSVFFKCEFENPTGSAKDRGFAYQISKHFQNGTKHAVISSSGNAALSASKFCSLAKINLTVFVSPRINKNKLDRLVDSQVKIVKSKRAVSGAVKYAKEKEIPNLRQSTDMYSIYGYQTIAFELADSLSGNDALFVPVSSGTSLYGIISGFKLLGKKVAYHAVQTEKVHPLASDYDKKYKEKNKSIADAIVAKFMPRKDKLKNEIDSSDGFGWVVSDSSMKKAHAWLNKNNIHTSFEGAACLAAIWKAKATGRFSYKRIYCVLTGKYYG